MQGNTWIIWLVMLAAALVLEGLSMQLFSIWFALGALAALLSCVFFDAPAWVQVPLFILVTAAGLAASRPLVKRLQKRLMPPSEEPDPEEEAAP